jgi:hypothetical protein
MAEAVARDGMLAALPSRSDPDAHDTLHSHQSGAYTVVFFIRRGILDTWEGVVFESDGLDHGDPLAGGGPVDVESLGDGWYHVRTAQGIGNWSTTR